MDDRNDLRRPFQLLHQKVVLDIDIERRVLCGFTELTLSPQRTGLVHIQLNSRQCDIQSVCVNNVETTFQYRDALGTLLDSKRTGPPKVFEEKYRNAWDEADEGELTVSIPPQVSIVQDEWMEEHVANVSISDVAEREEETHAHIHSPSVSSSSHTPRYKQMVVRVHYVVENPIAGVVFAQDGISMIVHGGYKEARLWLPCFDSPLERCSWELEYTLLGGPEWMVVSTGQLVDSVYDASTHRRWFHYRTSDHVVLCAADICLAVGIFDCIQDVHLYPREESSSLPSVQTPSVSIHSTKEAHVYYFAPKGSTVALSQTTAFLHQLYEFAHEWLLMVPDQTIHEGSGFLEKTNASTTLVPTVHWQSQSLFPFGRHFYMVFTDNVSVEHVISKPGIILVNKTWLHTSHEVDVLMDARRHLAYGYMRQWFGCLVIPRAWPDLWLMVGFARYMASLFEERYYGRTDFEIQRIKELERLYMLEQTCAMREIDNHGYERDGRVDEPHRENVLGDSPVPSVSVSRTRLGPVYRENFILPEEWDQLNPWMHLKASLVLHMLERYIGGRDVLRHVLHRLIMTGQREACAGLVTKVEPHAKVETISLSAHTLTLPTSLPSPIIPYFLVPVALSTAGFLKCIKRWTERDPKHFAEQWIYHSQLPILYIRYFVNRRKNILEMRIRQTHVEDLVQGRMERLKRRQEETFHKSSEGISTMDDEGYFHDALLELDNNLGSWGAAKDRDRSLRHSRGRPKGRGKGEGPTGHVRKAKILGLSKTRRNKMHESKNAEQSEGGLDALVTRNVEEEQPIPRKAPPQGGVEKEDSSIQAMDTQVDDSLTAFQTKPTEVEHLGGQETVLSKQKMIDMSCTPSSSEPVGLLKQTTLLPIHGTLTFRIHEQDGRMYNHTVQMETVNVGENMGASTSGARASSVFRVGQWLEQYVEFPLRFKGRMRKTGPYKGSVRMGKKQMLGKKSKKNDGLGGLEDENLPVDGEFDDLFHEGDESSQKRQSTTKMKRKHNGRKKKQFRKDEEQTIKQPSIASNLYSLPDVEARMNTSTEAFVLLRPLSSLEMDEEETRLDLFVRREQDLSVRWIQLDPEMEWMGVFTFIHCIPDIYRMRASEVFASTKSETVSQGSSWTPDKPIHQTTLLPLFTSLLLNPQFSSEWITCAMIRQLLEDRNIRAQYQSLQTLHRRVMHMILYLCRRVLNNVPSTLKPLLNISVPGKSSTGTDSVCEVPTEEMRAFLVIRALLWVFARVAKDKRFYYRLRIEALYSLASLTGCISAQRCMWIDNRTKWINIQVMRLLLSVYQSLFGLQLLSKESHSKSYVFTDSFAFPFSISVQPAILSWNEYFVLRALNSSIVCALQPILTQAGNLELMQMDTQDGPFAREIRRECLQFCFQFFDWFCLSEQTLDETCEGRNASINLPTTSSSAECTYGFMRDRLLADWMTGLSQLAHAMMHWNATIEVSKHARLPGSTVHSFISGSPREFIELIQHEVRRQLRRDWYLFPTIADERAMRQGEASTFHSRFAITRDSLQCLTILHLTNQIPLLERIFTQSKAHEKVRIQVIRSLFALGRAGKAADVRMWCERMMNVDKDEETRLDLGPEVRKNLFWLLHGMYASGISSEQVLRECQTGKMYEEFQPQTTPSFSTFPHVVFVYPPARWLSVWNPFDAALLLVRKHLWPLSTFGLSMPLSGYSMDGTDSWMDMGSSIYSFSLSLGCYQSVYWTGALTTHELSVDQQRTDSAAQISAPAQLESMYRTLWQWMNEHPRCQFDSTMRVHLFAWYQTVRLLLPRDRIKELEADIQYLEIKLPRLRIFLAGAEKRVLAVEPNVSEEGYNAIERTYEKQGQEVLGNVMASDEHSLVNVPFTSSVSTSTIARTVSQSIQSVASLDFQQSKDYEHCKRITQKLHAHKDSFPFFNPVDAVGLQIPNYFSIISHPLDLSSIQARLHRLPLPPLPELHPLRPPEFLLPYESAEAVKRDIDQIFANCFTFNPPGTPVYIFGKRLERYWTSLWNNTFVNRTGLSEKKDKKEKDTRANALPILPPSSPHQIFTDSEQSPTTHVVNWDPHTFALLMLDKITAHPASLPFCQPVDPIAQGVPTYYELIKHPMDLETMRKQLSLGIYNDFLHGEQHLDADFRLIFSNCYLFNLEDSPIYKTARQLERYYEHVRSEFSLRQKKMDSRSLSSAATSICEHVFHRLYEHRDSPSFIDPVNALLLGVPNYYDVITHPMDLRTIYMKLQRGIYTTPEQFETDIRRIFKNCMDFNASDTPIMDGARRLEMFFVRIWKRERDRLGVEAGTSVRSRASGLNPIDIPLIQSSTMSSSIRSPHVPSKPSDSPKSNYHTVDSLSSGQPASPVSSLYEGSFHESTANMDSHNEPPCRALPSYTSEHTSSSPMTTCIDVFLQCQQLLRRMILHPSSRPFREPVDPIALNIPHYYQIIAHPMDLKTIDGRLQFTLDTFGHALHAGYITIAQVPHMHILYTPPSFLPAFYPSPHHLYNSPQDFAQDVLQMLTNCFTFNEPNTSVYQEGQKLETYFKKRWTELDKLFEKTLEKRTNFSVHEVHASSTKENNVHVESNMSASPLSSSPSPMMMKTPSHHQIPPTEPVTLDNPPLDTKETPPLPKLKLKLKLVQ